MVCGLASAGGVVWGWWCGGRGKGKVVREVGELIACEVLPGRCEN